LEYQREKPRQGGSTKSHALVAGNKNIFISKKEKAKINYRRLCVDTDMHAKHVCLPTKLQRKSHKRGAPRLPRPGEPCKIAQRERKMKKKPLRLETHKKMNAEKLSCPPSLEAKPRDFQENSMNLN
jgi:hypothetical protein